MQIDDHNTMYTTKPLHTLQKFLELRNWVICSRNKRSKEVSGTYVQCMQAKIIITQPSIEIQSEIINIITGI